MVFLETAYHNNLILWYMNMIIKLYQGHGLHNFRSVKFHNIPNQSNQIKSNQVSFTVKKHATHFKGLNAESIDVDSQC